MKKTDLIRQAKSALSNHKTADIDMDPNGSGLESTKLTLRNNAGDEDVAKMALVAEGGGQRGIFTAGVLDIWLKSKFDPFDLLIGTSSGSQNLTSFLSRQKGYAKRLICGLSRRKRFYHLGRGLVGGNIVDIDWYFDETVQGRFALDFATARKSLGQREFLITVTNSRDRKAYFLKAKGDNNHWRKLLKASSALPFLYKQGVKLASKVVVKSSNQKQANIPNNSHDFYLDGGLAAPLPVREAYRRGARKIVVIRTVNAELKAGEHAQSDWLRKIKQRIYGSKYCPKTIDYLVQHELSYAKELAFIAKPPEDCEIIQIFAKEKLQSKLLGSTYEELQHDYCAGVAAGSDFLQDYSQKANG
jgi:predicted patatin/cPLA2 family phospholipase